MFTNICCRYPKWVPDTCTFSSTEVSESQSPPWDGIKKEPNLVLHHSRAGLCHLTLEIQSFFRLLVSLTLLLGSLVSSAFLIPCFNWTQHICLISVNPYVPDFGFLFSLLEFSSNPTAIWEGMELEEKPPV